MIQKSECRCNNCVNACRNPADTEPDDDYWISQFLKIPRDKLVKEMFDETPIVVIKTHGNEFVMRGLKPKVVNGWCIFFKKGLCSIHSVKPFGCKYASCKTTYQQYKEIADYLANKWHIKTLVEGRLELEPYDLNNTKQQQEIFAKLK